MILLTVSRMWNLLPCPVCHHGDGNGRNELCPECVARLRPIEGMRCPGCGGRIDGILGLCGKCLREEPRPWNRALTLFEYRSFGKELVRDFKFRNRPELARAFGLAAARLLRESGEPVDALVPVPLYWTRYLSRGYNQAGLFARICADELGVPCVTALRRTLPTGHQSLLTRKDRQKNLRRAFATTPAAALLAGRNVWLCDDVLTTGMTLQAAAEPLIALGATVRVLSIARA